MGRHSSIARLPQDIRAEIGRLRDDGRTIDEILAHLRAMPQAADISRSALGRHVQRHDKIGDKMRRSRDVAVALVREMGEAPESQAARVNIELMHSAIMDLHLRAADGEDGIDKHGQAALAGDPEGLMFLSKALDHLTRSSKSNVDFIRAAEDRAMERTKREASRAVEAIARERGITADTITAIKAGIFGVKAEAPK